MRRAAFSRRGGAKVVRGRKFGGEIELSVSQKWRISAVSDVSFTYNGLIDSPIDTDIGTDVFRDSCMYLYISVSSVSSVRREVFQSFSPYVFPYTPD